MAGHVYGINILLPFLENIYLTNINLWQAKNTSLARLAECRSMCSCFLQFEVLPDLPVRRFQARFVETESMGVLHAVAYL
jgi:hypothetical protein